MLLSHKKFHVYYRSDNQISKLRSPLHERRDGTTVADALFSQAFLRPARFSFIVLPISNEAGKLHWQVSLKLACIDFGTGPRVASSIFITSPLTTNGVFGSPALVAR
jgi:hypothetical protein